MKRSFNVLLATAAVAVFAGAGVGVAAAQAYPPAANIGHNTDEMHSGYPNPGARARDVSGTVELRRVGTDEILSGVPNPGTFRSGASAGASQAAPKPAGIEHMTDEMHSGYPNPVRGKK